MSLLVWLPLMTDLHNQGVGNCSMTLASGNQFLSTEGKIGIGALQLTKRQPVSTTLFQNKKQISWAYWVKVNTTWEANWLDGIYWITSDGSSTAGNRQEFYTNCTKVGMWYKGGSISNKAFTPGVWTHLAGTVDYKNGTAAFYINGVCQGRTTNVDTTHYITSVYLGDSGIDISENDVRIYDHILSDKEVKELSKCLVLHHKLDAINAENLLESTPKNYNASAYQAYQLNLTENLRRGNTYTLQLWNVNVSHSAKSAADLGVSIYWGGGSAALINWKGTSYFTDGHADYLSITFTIPASVSPNGTQNNFLCIYNSVPSVAGTLSMSIGSWKLTHADSRDCSGYKHDGTYALDLEPNNDTPRYDSSANFKGTSSSYIKILDNTWMAQGATEMTISFWAKANWSTVRRFASCTESGGWNCFESANTGYQRWPIYTFTNAEQTTRAYSYSSTGLKTADLTEGWHMFTLIYTTSAMTIYLDGTFYSTYEKQTYGISYNKNARLFLGCEASGANPSSPWLTAQMSDFRLYYTALSTEDIKELYDTSASIDNNGNVYAREVIET